MATKKQSRYEVESEGMSAQETQKSHRNAKRAVFYVLLFMVILAVFGILFINREFRIKSITVEGNEHYDDSLIIERSGFSVEDNIFRIDEETAKKNILTELPFVGEVEVVKQYPDKLVIKITDIKAAAYIELHDKYYILSSTMKVLEGTTKRPSNLTRLNLSSDKVTRCIQGKTLTLTDEKMDEALSQLCIELEKNELSENIAEIRLKDRFSIYLEYLDRYTVYVGNVRQLDVKIGFLVEIINKLTVDTGWKVTEGKENLDTQVGRIDVSSAKEGIYSPIKR